MSGCDQNFTKQSQWTDQNRCGQQLKSVWLSHQATQPPGPVSTSNYPHIFWILVALTITADISVHKHAWDHAIHT